jgi:hypothetical protein
MKFGLLEKLPCTPKENEEYKRLLEIGAELPEGVYPVVDGWGEASSSEFYTICKPDLSESEIAEFLTYKKLSLIRTIKNCLVFFTTLTVISLIVCVLSFLSNNV